MQQHPIPPDAAHTENSLMLAQDFEELQAEVEAQAEGLCILSPELCQQLLTGLGQVLRDEMTLHHLEELVSQGWRCGTVQGGGVGSEAGMQVYLALCHQLEQGLCCGRVELQTGPVGDVLECLVQPCRMLEEELVEHFFYLLGALAGEHWRTLKGVEGLVARMPPLFTVCPPQS